MLSIFKKGFVLLCLLLVTTLAAETSFYDGYNREEQEKIAKAYEAVADHFEGQGNEKRAEQYRGTAREIRKTLGGPMEMAIPELEVEDSTLLEEQAEAAPEVLRAFLEAILREDQSKVESFISSRFYLPNYDDGFTREEAITYVRRVFEENDFWSQDLNDYYRMEELQVVLGSSNNWLLSIPLSPLGAEELEKTLGLPSSGEVHTFLLREYQEGWRVIGFNW